MFEGYRLWQVELRKKDNWRASHEEAQLHEQQKGGCSSEKDSNFQQVFHIMWEAIFFSFLIIIFSVFETPIHSDIFYNFLSIIEDDL